MLAKYCHVGSTTVGVFSTMSHYVVKKHFQWKGLLFMRFLVSHTRKDEKLRS